MSWFKDGKPLKPDDQVQIGVDGDEFFIELSECDAEAAGEYTCTASNVAGDACCTVNVIVTGAPYLLIDHLSSLTCAITVNVSSSTICFHECTVRNLSRYTDRILQVYSLDNS